MDSDVQHKKVCVQVKNRKLKRQRRRRLRKRHLKSELALPQTLSRLFQASRLILQMLAKCFGVDSRGLFQSSRKEKESCCLVFPSSTKREIRLRNVQKKCKAHA